MGDDERNEYDEQNVLELVKSYEDKRRLQQACYFDVEDFAAIIDHYLFDHDIPEAVEAVEIASYYYPISFEIKLKKAEVEVENDNVHEALKLLDEIEPFAFNYLLDLQTVRVRALLELEKVQESVAIVAGLVKESLVSRNLEVQQVVAELIEAEEFTHALHFLHMLEKQHAENKTLLLDLAYCYERLANHKQAAFYYEQYLEEDPFSFSAWYEAGRMYELMGDHQKSLVAFDFSITINDTYLMAYIGKASSLTNVEKFEEAIAVLEEILLLDPSNLAASCAIAECYQKLGDNSEAIRIYLSVIERDASLTEAYYGVALLFEKEGRHAESLSFMQKVAELAPSNLDYMFDLGKLLMLNNRNAEAVEVFKKVVESDHNDTESWLLLYELQSISSPQLALSCLEKAANYAYNAPEICYRLAAAYYQENKLEKCSELFARGVEANAGMVGVFFNLCPEAYHEEQIMTIYLNNKSKEHHDF